ncbi:MAG: hypothetical protein ABSG86_19855 [Thermoguttaceae bacterium]|jgi:hypothetical protein
MRIALLAGGLFAAAFLVHWLVWRIRIPRRQTPALLVILLGSLPLGLAAVAYVPALQPLGPLGFWECIHVGTFHVAMSLGYIVCYSALAERSPSMTLLGFVDDAGPQGRSPDEVVSVLARAQPVEARLEALVRHRAVVETGDAYRLSAKGRFWARAFSFWLCLMGAAKGG